MATKTITPDKVTDAQIEAWKKKHEQVYVYNVDGKVCYLSRPTRQTLAAATVLGGGDPYKYNETILTNCWLAGDEEIKTDDSLFLGICGHLSEIVEIKEGELKKL